MPRTVRPAETLKQRNKWLSYAEEQDWMAQNCDKQGFPVSAARHRTSAAKYREAASAFRPNIEGEE